MCQLNLHVLIIEYYGIFVAYLFTIFIDLNTDQKALIILVFKFKVNCLQTMKLLYLTVYVRLTFY